MAHDHTAHGQAHDHKGDARAAYMGLIFGMIALLGICYTIVQLTNRKFEAHAKPGVPATTPAAPH